MMKKLSLYIFLVLMWCNVGFAELIIFSDIKVGEKVSKYINDQQISKFYMSDREAKEDVIIYDKDKKYSYLLFLKEDGIFKEDYDFLQIYYENSTNKIVGTVGGVLMSGEDKDSCLKKRKTDVEMYIKKNRITSLFSKKQDKQTFPDGLIDDYVMFSGKDKYLAFTCFIRPHKIEYRVESLEYNYNDHIFKIQNQP